MKLNKLTLVVFVLLIVIGSVFRLMGFAPQIALAIFGAAVIQDKKLAFVLPLVSMFLSDVLFEILFAYGYTSYGGFYEGQVANYLLLAGITLIGFLARDLKWNNILLAILAAPTVYFLTSNFVVWFAGAGFQRPKTFEGLMMSFADGLPFFRSSLVYTMIFSAVLFGGYFLVQRYMLSKKQLA